MAGLGESSLVELMSQRKEYFSVLANHELVIPARVYKIMSKILLRDFYYYFYQSFSSPPKEDKTTFDTALKCIGNHQRGFSHSTRISTRHHNVYTKAHSLYPLCLHPVLIIKCSAQEFVEEQVTRSKRKPPLIYKYCVNFMITRDLWTGCCKREAEGVCLRNAER